MTRKKTVLITWLTWITFDGPNFDSHTLNHAKHRVFVSVMIRELQIFSTFSFVTGEIVYKRSGFFPTGKFNLRHDTTHRVWN